MRVAPAVLGLRVLAERLAAALDDARARSGFPGATAAIALPDGAVVTTAGVLAPESEGRPARPDLLSRHLGDRAGFDDLPNACAITIGPLLHQTLCRPDHVHLPALRKAWEDLAPGAGAVEPEALVGFIPGHVSHLRRRADHDVTVAFRIDTDAGLPDGSSDLVPARAAALADLAIGAAT